MPLLQKDIVTGYVDVVPCYDFVSGEEVLIPTNGAQDTTRACQLELIGRKTLLCMLFIVFCCDSRAAFLLLYLL